MDMSISIVLGGVELGKESLDAVLAHIFLDERARRGARFFIAVPELDENIASLARRGGRDA